MAQFSFSFCPESCRAAEHRHYLPPAASQQETHRKTSRKSTLESRIKVCLYVMKRNAISMGMLYILETKHLPILEKKML